MSGAKEKYLNMGFDDYMAKPFSRETISNKLYSIFHSQNKQQPQQYVTQTITYTVPANQVEQVPYVQPVVQQMSHLEQPQQTIPVVTPQTVTPQVVTTMPVQPQSVVIENMVVNENPVIVNAQPEETIEIQNTNK